MPLISGTRSIVNELIENPKTRVPSLLIEIEAQLAMTKREFISAEKGSDRARMRMRNHLKNIEQIALEIRRRTTTGQAT
jgi:hypothetical protein